MFDPAEICENLLFQKGRTRRLIEVSRRGGIVDTGKLLIIVGVGIVLLGLALKYAPWLVNWFGKLPGDINFENPNSRIFVPITSMIVVSLIVTLIANLWFRK